MLIMKRRKSTPIGVPPSHYAQRLAICLYASPNVAFSTDSIAINRTE